MRKNSDYFVGIDIGSSKTVAMIGELGDAGELKIIGYSMRKSEGIKQGIITDIWKASDTVKKVVEDAEMMADLPITEAYVGVSSLNLRGINSRGTINITNKDGIIYEADVLRAMEQAKNISLPPTEEIVYIIAQGFKVGEQGGIVNPIGMVGNKLDVEVRIITLPTTIRRNLLTCIEDANIEVKKIVPNFISAAETVLTDDEKELGVMLIDIGKSLVSIAVYNRGSLWFDSVFPAGAEYFIRDVAVGFNINRLSEAEKIIKKYGTLVPVEDSEEFIEIESPETGKKKQIPFQSMMDILLPRAEEIFEKIKTYLDNIGAIELLNAGIVITGGGANLRGIEEIVSQIFNLPARVGNVSKKDIDGAAAELMHPEFASSFGLLLLAKKEGDFVSKRAKKGISRFFYDVWRKVF